MEEISRDRIPCSIFQKLVLLKLTPTFYLSKTFNWFTIAVPLPVPPSVPWHLARLSQSRWASPLSTILRATYFYIDPLEVLVYARAEVKVGAETRALLKPGAEVIRAEAHGSTSLETGAPVLFASLSGSLWPAELGGAFFRAREPGAAFRYN